MAAPGYGQRRADSERLLLPPSSASSLTVSRVARELSSLGSSGGALKPEYLFLTLYGSGCSNLHVFAHAELHAGTTRFSRANYLGCGGYDPVYLGQVNAQPVAVKYLDLDGGTQGHREWLVLDVQLYMAGPRL